LGLKDGLVADQIDGAVHVVGGQRRKEALDWGCYGDTAAMIDVGGHREQPSLLEDSLGNRHGVECAGKPGVRNHMDDRFDHLLGAKPHVESGADVDIELGFATPKGRQRAKGDQLSPRRIQIGTGVNVAKAELDDVALRAEDDVRVDHVAGARAREQSTDFGDVDLVERHDSRLLGSQPSRDPSLPRQIADSLCARGRRNTDDLSPQDSGIEQDVEISVAALDRNQRTGVKRVTAQAAAPGRSTPGVPLARDP
jgi:hypothetical protein